MQEHLQDALRDHIGQTITPELASRIYAAALYRPDRSIPTYRFDVVEYRGYVFQCEPPDKILAELEPLHAAQWAETEKYRHALPRNPNIERGLQYWRDGQLVQFTVRHAGAMAGHMRMYLVPCMHSQALLAHEDTLFIVPEHRASFVGLNFLAYVDQQMTKLGPDEIAFDAKLANKAHVLLERLNRTRGLDYQPVSTHFVRYPKKES